MWLFLKVVAVVLGTRDCVSVCAPLNLSEVHGHCCCCGVAAEGLKYSVAVEVIVDCDHHHCDACAEWPRRRKKSPWQRHECQTASVGDDDFGDSCRCGRRWTRGLRGSGGVSLLDCPVCLSCLEKEERTCRRDRRRCGSCYHCHLLLPSCPSYERLRSVTEKILWTFAQA